MARRWAMAAAALVMAAACAPEGRGAGTGPAGQRPGDRPHEPGQAQSTGPEFGVTHHALIRGTVVGAGGQPLRGVHVVTDGMGDTPGSMPRNRAVTGADGGFSVPAQATFVNDADSARVVVLLVGYGFAQAAGDAVPVDSARIPVTLVRTGRPPPVYTTRLRMPVPR